MTAAGTIETLIRLGALVKDAARRPSDASSIDWGAFLASPGFAEIETAVKTLPHPQGEPEIQEAIPTIQPNERGPHAHPNKTQPPPHHPTPYNQHGNAAHT